MSDITMNPDMTENEKSRKIVLTKKDITKTWAFWMLFQRMSQCFERYYGLGVCITMIPVLKKLYPDKDELSKALTGILQPL